MLLHLKDVVELRQEPLVNIGHLVNLVDTVTPVECGGDGEYALIRRVDQFFINIFDELVLEQHS